MFKFLLLFMIAPPGAILLLAALYLSGVWQAPAVALVPLLILFAVTVVVLLF